MRVKERCVLISFRTTNEAMAFEYKCEGMITGRLIPLPPLIHAGCGLAWKSSVKEKLNLLNLIKKENLTYDEIYELEL